MGLLRPSVLPVILCSSCTKNTVVKAIKTFAKCHIEVRFLDHNPPHFHVVMKADRREALVTILDLKVTGRTIKPSEIREALEWAADNTQLLLKAWKDAHP
jgi:hypothetical protein